MLVSPTSTYMSFKFKCKYNIMRYFLSHKNMHSFCLHSFGTLLRHKLFTMRLSLSMCNNFINQSEIISLLTTQCDPFLNQNINSTFKKKILCTPKN